MRSFMTLENVNLSDCALFRRRIWMWRWNLLCCTKRTCDVLSSSQSRTVLDPGVVVGCCALACPLWYWMKIYQTNQCHQDYKYEIQCCSLECWYCRRKLKAVLPRTLLHSRVSTGLACWISYHFLLDFLNSSFIWGLESCSRYFCVHTLIDAHDSVYSIVQPYLLCLVVTPV